MEIRGASLYNTYSGGYLNRTQSRSAQAAQSVGPEPVTPVNPAKESKSGSGSAIDVQNAADSGDRKAEKDKSESGSNRFSSKQLSEEDLRKTQELKQRDREVRAHEAAHLAAAGRYATGGASFEYERGPDGKSYAVGGEVGIDTSPVPNDPEATIQKARMIKAAALAPADPSSTDRKVAASAAQMEAEARRDISEQRFAENKKTDSTNNEPVALEPDKENADPAGIGYSAASSYKVVDDISRSEINAVPQIELTA